MSTSNFLRGGASVVKRVLCNGLHQNKDTASQPMHNCSTMTTHARCASHVSVTMDTKTATVTLNRPPVNSLNIEVLTDLHVTLEKLDKSAKGIILTSGLKNVFSGGLDIQEMYQPTRERLSAFWFNFQEVYIKLYGSSRPVITAINGNSPAGGCLLALCTDYRIMADGKFKIGANEVHLGILAPFWFEDLIVSTIGEREASKALQLGMMYSSREALQVGLVDKVVPQEEVLAAAQEEMQRWIAIPDYARHMSKVRMNKQNLQHMMSRRDEDITTSVDFIMRDSIQKNIGAYLEALKAKAK